VKKILLIEDEKNMARFIELELRHEAFDVTVAGDGISGLQMAIQESWDLILLDLMLPGMGGLELCSEIRKTRRVPVLIITARDSVSDRVSGLDSGADDYIAKPFAIEELLARIRVVFRRQAESLEQGPSVLRVASLSMDRDARTVRRGTQAISLTKREFALLEAFMSSPNRVLSRESLLDRVWGYDRAVDNNVVDVYVRYLRNKIDLPEEPSCIESVRGVGYIMRAT